MKEQTKYIVVGKFQRDGNGNPCLSLSKEDLNFIDMDKDYIFTISGPINDVSHKQLKSGNKIKSILRCMPDGVSFIS